jgi:hypothetical protein
MAWDPAQVKPSALLWTYELQREQESLTQHMKQAKDQIEKTEDLVGHLSTCLKDLTVIVASVATSLNDQTPQGQQRLRRLQTELNEIVLPVYNRAKTIVNRNETLLATIAKLRGLHNTANFGTTITAPKAPPGLELTTPKTSAFPEPTTPEELLGPTGRKAWPKPKPDPNKEFASSPITQVLLDLSRSGTDPSKYKDAEAVRIEKHAIANILSRETFDRNVKKFIQQRNRPISEYFDEAHEFRRRWSIAVYGNGPTKDTNDALMISSFIAGLDSPLYRRRFKHWLRKEHWTWNFVCHFTQILVMEEEYMAKQEYAMDHQLEDGSVLFPDGERCYRFSYLPPITDEDLTSSDIYDD